MKTCNKCGTQVIDEAVFCTSCGAILEDETEETGVLFEEEENSHQDIYTPQPIYEPQPMDTENANPAYVNPAFNQDVKQPPVQTQQNYYNPRQSEQNINSQNTYQQTIPNAMPGAKLSYEEFYDRFASKKTKNNAKTVGIICIITAVVGLGILGMRTNALYAIDIIFYSVFAGLILKKKKWVLTLLVCIYGGVFTIIGLVISGTPSGIFAFVMSIIATISLKKVDDAYKQYLVKNQLPQNKI